jgi:deazaflavin-dependent oxidoreductase (nitroreductase family)
MSLADQLGYAHKKPNLFQRANRRFARTSFGAWMFSHTLRYGDKVVAKYGKGRTIPELVAGLPSVFVTTTGAKSGAKRTSALLAVPAGDGLALVGTNFGQAKTPNWYYNLKKNPAAEIRYREKSVAVTAREVTRGPERQAILRSARKIYAGYAAYEARIKDRPIHVMVLEPT